MQSQFADDFGGGGGGLQMPRMTPAVKRLILVTCAVFLVQLIAGMFGARSGFIEAFALYPPSWHTIFVPFWQLLTYGFLHDPLNASHILFNMLFLYMFGTWLEGTIGGRRLIVFYLAAIVIGGAAQLAVSLLLGHGSPVLGASGAVLAVTIAMATLEPQRRIIFIIVPMTMKTLAIIVVGKDVLGLLMDLSNGSGGVAHVVHLAGAATGFLAIRTGMIWRDPVQVVSHRLERREAEQEQDVRKKLDVLLAKISREGIQSLSSSEKKFLKRASKR